jgi:hypothetical protein
LVAVLEGIATITKDRGVLYASFKHGDEEREKSGRYFNDMNEELLSEFVKEEVAFHTLKSWKISRSESRTSFRRVAQLPSRQEQGEA